GAAEAVPEVATRMAALNKTAAPAKSRVFLMCPSRGRAVMGSPLPIVVLRCERSQYLSTRRSLSPHGSTHGLIRGSGPPVRLDRPAAAGRSVWRMAMMQCDESSISRTATVATAATGYTTATVHRRSIAAMLSDGHDMVNVNRNP